MSILTIITILIFGFLAALALLVAFQTWIRLSAPQPSAAANVRRCLWVAFVIGVWWPWVVISSWNAKAAPWNVWTSIEDQRLFLVGVSPTLLVVGLTSVVQPWAYSVRTWLLGANFLAAGLFYGLFVGAVDWPGNLFTYQFLFWPAAGFGMSIWHVIRSQPGQSSAADSSVTGSPVGNGPPHRLDIAG
jgi:hypothetical protein